MGNFELLTHDEKIVQILCDFFKIGKMVNYLNFLKEIEGVNFDKTKPSFKNDQNSLEN